MHAVIGALDLYHTHLPPPLSTLDIFDVLPSWSLVHWVVIAIIIVLIASFDGIFWESHLIKEAQSRSKPLVDTAGIPYGITKKRGAAKYVAPAAIFVVLMGAYFLLPQEVKTQQSTAPSSSQVASGIIKQQESQADQTKKEGPALPEAPHSRIVVSKFIINRFDAHDANSGYQILLYMINRGNLPGYTPVSNFSFWSVEKRSSDMEIDEEMSKIVKLALHQFPTRTDDREQLEVGVEHHAMLPSGLTPNAYTMISSGQKIFYLFVVLTYYDDSLPVGQFWVSEFCGWQSKDLSYFQLCKGHNKTWLSKN